ncbi:MAG: Heat shock protein 15 [Paracidovorax wautersii]|uniref:Heat shock protein 15 n=1 Tax=Paracidovorax wautersii TaxID=1177982 RepID=A0A7V8JQ82_9BURK|nr:MAG: Heat shock protein 15 [Paracidovorax wautersii]
MDKLRIDKWLWAARFFKTRRLAVDALDHGRVRVNGQPAKPSREVKPGDEVSLVQPGGVLRSVKVLGASNQRGPAPVAQQLYTETPESVAAREEAARQRHLAPEPALGHAEGRPTRRDRRQIERLQDDDGARDAWGDRWSAEWR